MASTSPQSFAEDDDFSINSASTEGTTNIKERREFAEEEVPATTESLAQASTAERTGKLLGSVGTSSRSGFTELTTGSESRFSGLTGEDSESISQIPTTEKPRTAAEQFESSGMTEQTLLSGSGESATSRDAASALFVRSNSGRTLGSGSTDRTENITAAERRLSVATDLTQNVTNVRPTLNPTREESVRSLSTTGTAESTGNESNASSALVPYNAATAGIGGEGVDNTIGERQYSNYAAPPQDDDTETDDGGDTFNSNLMDDAARRARRMHTPLEVRYDSSDATVGVSTVGHGTLGEGTYAYAGDAGSTAASNVDGGDALYSSGTPNDQNGGALVATHAALPPGAMGPPPPPHGGDPNASTFGASTYANSNQSAGWSRYDDPGQSIGTMDTNTEFFERALPPSTTHSQAPSSQYQGSRGQFPADAATMGGPSTLGGSAMGASNVSAGWSRYDDDGNTLDTMDTNAEFFERALPPSESSGAQFAQGGAPPPTGVSGGSTIGGSHMSGTGNSTQSQGWSRYDEDGNTIETMDTNVEFFERALPYQPGDGMSQVQGQYDKQQSQDPGSVAATGVAPSQMMGDDDPSHYSGQSSNSKQSSYHTKQTAATSSSASVTASATASVADASVSTGTGSSAQIDVNSRSQRGSSLTYTESRSGSDGTFQSTGILYRQAPNKWSAAAREVEVSMDGFLHQKKISDERTVATTPYTTFYEEYFYEEDEEGGRKKFSIKNACTYIPVLFMVLSSLFFASQIGPFYIVPSRPGPMASDGIKIKNKNGTSFLTDQEVGDMEAIPDNLNVAFVNWRMIYEPSKKRDMPVLWNYAMSGGTIASHVFGFCLGRVQAGIRREFDPTGTHDESFAASGLRIIKSGKQMFGNEDLGGQLFVNVDMGTPAGVMRAIQFALPSAYVADVVTAPVLHPMASLFQPQQGRVKAEVQGRLMIVFRDPLHRSLNRYEELKKLDTNLSQLTLMEYATSPLFKENNPLIRAILGLGPNDPLGDQELKVAQSFVSQKVLVGVYDEMQPTLELWEKYFGWYVGDTILPVQTCHDMVEEVIKTELFEVSRNYAATDADAFNMLLAANRMDRILYDFAKTLFWKQKAVIEKVLKQKAAVEAAGR